MFIRSINRFVNGGRSIHRFELTNEMFYTLNIPRPFCIGYYDNMLIVTVIENQIFLRGILWMICSTAKWSRWARVRMWNYIVRYVTENIKYRNVCTPYKSLILFTVPDSSALSWDFCCCFTYWNCFALRHHSPTIKFHVPGTPF